MCIRDSYTPPTDPGQPEAQIKEQSPTEWEAGEESDELSLESDEGDIVQEESTKPSDSIEESWEPTPGMTEASGFDLDLEILDEPVDEHPEIQEVVAADEGDQEVDDAYVTEDSLPFAGVFGGLRSRRRIINDELDSIPEGQFKATEKGTAFWTAEEQLPFAGQNDDAPETVSIDEPQQPTAEEIDPTELFEVEPDVDFPIDSTTIETFTRLLAQVLRPSNAGLSGEQSLVEQLRALSRPRLTQKEEHVLSIAALSSLTASESVVVAEAKSRSISPSDKALLERLSIKRARLSQICNRLHKAGILHARMVGRSRMFGLTRTALAQLIAWGIVGGEDQ